MPRPKDTTTHPLSEVRQRLDLRQADVALMLDVSPALISQWERRAIRPHPIWLPRLAAVYKLDLPTLDAMLKPREDDPFDLTTTHATPPVSATRREPVERAR